MERESNKREREGAEKEETNGKDPVEETSKRQHLGNTSSDDEENSEKDDYLTLGVFDFPWRKESLIGKSEEDWCFEDSFFDNKNYPAAVESEFPDQCLSENAEAFTECIDFPSDKFEETVWSSENWTSINA